MFTERNIRGVLAAGTMLIGLQACNFAPSKRVTEPPPSSPKAQQQFRATRPSTAPVKTLVEKAQYAQRAGHPEQAAASVERALRIDPYNPSLWHQLAIIRLKQGDAAQAQVMAAKSNSLAANDKGLRAKNRSITAQARRLRGRKQGHR
jgi:Tfp pilus assembly protein PilF